MPENSIKLRVQRVSQPIGEILLTKIDPQSLLIMSKVDRRRIETGDKERQIKGIQREINPRKVKQIKNYLSSQNATFPNSIIVNVDSKFIKNKNDQILELIINENTFSIIDGQHRLEGFRDIPSTNFELVLSIFIDLDKDKQARVFSTINSEQTKVNPSLNLNLELSSKEYTPRKMMIEIAQSFDYDNESPWYNNIQMLGSSKDGIISLSAFVNPLFDLTFRESDYFLILNELEKQSELDTFPQFNNIHYNEKDYIFWEFYKNRDFNAVYKILYNYFTSLKEVFTEDWLNDKALLNKTTGYAALMKLFKTIYLIGVDKGVLNLDFFMNILEPLQKLDGLVNSTNYATSGRVGQDILYNDMIKALRKGGVSI